MAPPGEEVEGGHDLGADHRMVTHQRPLVGVERAALAQQCLRHADLANVVQEAGVGDRLDLVGGQSERHGQASSPGADSLGVAPRARILGLERVGEAEQGLADRALELVIEASHVLGVAEALQVGRRYSGSHATLGISPSTSVSKRTGENGLVR